MNLQINFHQIESTPSIKERIEQKCKKLEKYFDGNYEVNWTCSTSKEGHHSHVILIANGWTINADSTRDDLYKTFDDALGKVEKQILKKKSQSKDKIHHKHGIESL